MVYLIIACLLVLIATIIICSIIVTKSKKRKKIIEQEISVLLQQEKEKQEAIQIIDDNITEKKTDYEKIIGAIQDQTNTQQTLNQELQYINGQIKGANKELDNINTIFAKNKQQLSDAQEQNSQILKNIDEKFQNDLERLVKSYQDKSEEYESQLDDLREKRNAAIQAAIEEYESSENRRFYMLQLSKEDISDIQTLRQLEGILHNKEILGKLIYKTYIEKPYTDLVGRVLNKEDFSGIYKITNELNQMCYIGQAANIKKRWQQHIKRAVGAEALVNNKLYPAMIEAGVENFSFEVVDRCEKDKLNEREQYWQDFYGAKVYGYSIK